MLQSEMARTSKLFIQKRCVRIWGGLQSCVQDIRAESESRALVDHSAIPDVGFTDVTAVCAGVDCSWRLRI